jgi:hypothetical protein
VKDFTDAEIRRALERLDLTHREEPALVRLIGLSLEKGYVWKNKEDLARLLRCSVRTLLNTLKRLCARGLLKTTKSWCTVYIPQWEAIGLEGPGSERELLRQRSAKTAEQDRQKLHALPYDQEERSEREEREGDQAEPDHPERSTTRKAAAPGAPAPARTGERAGLRQTKPAAAPSCENSKTVQKPATPAPSPQPLPISAEARKIIEAHGDGPEALRWMARSQCTPPELQHVAKRLCDYIAKGTLTTSLIALTRGLLKSIPAELANRAAAPQSPAAAAPRAAPSAPRDQLAEEVAAARAHFVELFPPSHPQHAKQRAIVEQLEAKLAARAAGSSAGPIDLDQARAQRAAATPPPPPVAALPAPERPEPPERALTPRQEALEAELAGPAGRLPPPTARPTGSPRNRRPLAKIDPLRLPLELLDLEELRERLHEVRAARGAAVVIPLPAPLPPQIEGIRVVRAGDPPRARMTTWPAEPTKKDHASSAVILDLAAARRARASPPAAGNPEQPDPQVPREPPDMSVLSPGNLDPHPNPEPPS